MAENTWTLSASTLADLQRSGISTDWALASSIKDATSSTTTAAHLRSEQVVDGYVIPYHDLAGVVNGHWRIRVLKAEPGTPKYKQAHKAGNHAYIPAGMPQGWVKDVGVDLVITEGEKKAIAAMAAGIPTIGLGGVDSWRSRYLKAKVADITPGEDGTMNVHLAAGPGARTVIDAVVPELTGITWEKRNVIICYDSDAAVNEDVQRAAFDLALWMDSRGANVTQYMLPPGPEGEKVGLDDWLLLGGEVEYGSFPLPANVFEWLYKYLANPKIGRVGLNLAARVSVGALDSDGVRYKDKVGNYYYFHEDDRILHPFRTDSLANLRSTSFGTLLHDRLGLKTADSSVISRIADGFAANAAQVVPRRCVTVVNGCVYWQISDGRVAKVDATGIEFVDNGTDDVLFLPDTVEPVDEEELGEAIDKWVPGKPLWLDALEGVNLRPMDPFTLGQTQRLLAALFYVSPWLYRWNGLMLPMEIAVAEPNSGKTFLYNLRKGILTGRPELTGLPEDFKGWTAAVSAASGIWVCDNLGNVRSDYWHRLNDELARILTDPKPTVEMRTLYTTADVTRVPITSVFAVTTIKNPFTAPDLLQRSLLFQLNAIPTDRRDGSWYTKRMARRVEWVAEQLIAVQLWLARAEAEWNPGRLTGYRLVGFEQALDIMLSVMGLEGVDVSMLSSAVTQSVTVNDPVIEALMAFKDEWVGPDRITVGDIVEWVQGDWQKRYSSIKTFGNSVVLGRYMNGHPYDIEQATGITLQRVRNQTVVKLR